MVTDSQKEVEQKLDNTEFAEVVLMPLNEFRELLKNGQNTDVEAGYIGLDYLKLL